jgi:hypothetical protein
MEGPLQRSIVAPASIKRNVPRAVVRTRLTTVGDPAENTRIITLSDGRNRVPTSTSGCQVATLTEGAAASRCSPAKLDVAPNAATAMARTKPAVARIQNTIAPTLQG